MKTRTVLLYCCLAGMLLNELFFVQKQFETFHFILFIGLPVVFAIGFVALLLARHPFPQKIAHAIVPLLLFVSYFALGNVMEKAAFNVSFALHKKAYQDFAETVLHQSDVLYRERKMQDSSGYVFLSELMDDLFADQTIKTKEGKLGLWGYNIHEIQQGAYVVEITVINGRQLLGLVYNPTGGIVSDNSYGPGRVFWCQSPPWSMWKESSGGFAAPG